MHTQPPWSVRSDASDVPSDAGRGALDVSANSRKKPSALSFSLLFLTRLTRPCQRLTQQLTGADNMPAQLRTCREAKLFWGETVHRTLRGLL